MFNNMDRISVHRYDIPIVFMSEADHCSVFVDGIMVDNIIDLKVYRSIVVVQNISTYSTEESCVSIHAVGRLFVPINKNTFSLYIRLPKDSGSINIFHCTRVDENTFIGHSIFLERRFI